MLNYKGNKIVEVIPNALSILRLVLSFVMIPFVLNNRLVLAGIVFGIAAITDFFDGYFARKFDVSSELGAMLDPLADKVLMTVSYFLFAYVNFIPVYLAVVVISRDVFILGVVIVCKISKVDLKIKPLMSSKINTTIQLIFIILVLACKCFSINVPFFIEMCALAVCGSTIFSGVEYVQKYHWIKGKLFQ